MINLRGIFPPLPTSFYENQDLYPEKIRENIEVLMKTDLAGILVLGSNGELVMLSEKEKEKVYATARVAIPPGKQMIAGTGGQSTRETVMITKMAAKHGADAALILNPFYYKGLMTPDVLVKHYHDVAEASDIPVIIYNMPANSGIDMNAETIVRIAEHPNVVGLKDSGGNIAKMGEIVINTRDDFQVLSGSAGFLLPALSIGAVGGILALANIFPRLCLDIINAFQKGELDSARQTQLSIISLNNVVTRQWGIPALKAAMDYQGLYGGAVRSPLMPLDETRKAELFKLLGILKNIPLTSG
ncbi:dihydrodipicolinate synthase family protein [Bacteroidota bacterium]